MEYTIRYLRYTIPEGLTKHAHKEMEEKKNFWAERTVYATDYFVISHSDQGIVGGVYVITGTMKYTVNHFYDHIETILTSEGFIVRDDTTPPKKSDKEILNEVFSVLSQKAKELGVELKWSEDRAGVISFVPMLPAKDER